MRQALAAVGGLLLLTGCATATLPRAEVDDVVREAFASAGIDVRSIEVGDATVDGSWPVEATVEGDPLELSVDAEEGRVTSIDIGVSTAIDDDELREVARYASNPAEDRAARRRRVAAFVVVVAAISGGLLLARRARLREEASS